MPDADVVRQDVIVSLALSLKRNQLSADEFKRQLNLMTREERASLVQYLDRLSTGPAEFDRTSSFGRQRNVA